MTCVIDECVNEAHSKGWCQTHYSRNRLHGSPHIVLNEMNKAEPEYGSIHSRLIRTIGPAKSFICECGEQARDWALMEKTAAIVISQSGKMKGSKYSYNLDDYKPMCRRCHNRMDRGTK